MKKAKNTDSKGKKIFLWFLDLAINIAIIFGLVVVIQTWLIAPFDVSGKSMCDTLNLLNNECQNGKGEKIMINEAGYALGEPERGEIIVFRVDQENSDEEKYLIKRIIGLPGETVEIKDGYVYVTPVNSEESIKINEPYLNSTNRGKTKTYFDDFSVFEVPEEHYFVMGDNRKFSTDSRSCFDNSITIDCKENPERAFISEEQIRGKAWFVWWPISSWRTLNQAEYPELAKYDDKTEE